MRYVNPFAGKLKTKIREMLHIAWPRSKRTAEKGTGRAGAGNEAAQRQAQHSAEATASVWALRLTR